MRFMFSLLVPAVLLGCNHAPPDRTIIAEATSPTGRSTAFLQHLHFDKALTADVYLLTIAVSKDDLERLGTGRALADSSVLVATWADKVRMQWRTDRELIVRCDSCGLEAADITKRVEQSGQTKIVYAGFPSRPFAE
jgi:hypothetical protein